MVMLRIKKICTNLSTVLQINLLRIVFSITVDMSMTDKVISKMQEKVRGFLLTTFKYTIFFSGITFLGNQGISTMKMNQWMLFLLTL